LRGGQRGRTDDLLVMWSRDLSPQHVSVERNDHRDMAVSSMPRLEQCLPPLLLVLRKHADEAAEARRLIRAGRVPQ
jgi:hypothetical protein